jgi:hypothetical protein
MRPYLHALDAYAMRPWQHQLLARVAALIAIYACLTVTASANQQAEVSFQVPRSDLADAEALANRLAALSPRVNREEAKLLADCAHATVSKLRREYRMFGTPIFNNFLIYRGIRKRGYCYHWAEDLLLALDSLKLNSFDLHWAETYAGTYRENNCIVATAKGEPFNRGIFLECWKHFGHLRWGPVAGDLDPYVENAAYAHFIRAKSAQRTSGAAEHVALQTQSEAKQKTN